MLRGKVNKGIRTTLMKEPDKFMAYNNGLSLTAESLQFVKGTGGQLAIKGITGLQVVNGGQTVATSLTTGPIWVSASSAFHTRRFLMLSATASTN